MESLHDLLSRTSELVWGPLVLVLLLGTGLCLTLGLRAMPVRRLGNGFRQLMHGRHHIDDDAGEITPFHALSTAFSETIGTGNIGGAATAIALGGPGAVFWMWITAPVGMATKYSEAALAVKYREVDKEGRYVGRPRSRTRRRAPATRCARALAPCSAPSSTPSSCAR